ncbi:MAG: amidohydrolase family protein, partial [Lentisphaeria bacterium]|nr:amidohydrolase family protein [Lentisphaeria bacterium]
MLRFENIWVAEGTEKAPFRATVLTDGGSIAAVAREKVAGISSADTIDGRGMILAPGFVDAHGHSDLSLLAAPEGYSKVTQGVTTEIAGNCGLSAYPLTELNREHLEHLYANYAQELDWNDYPSYRERLHAKRPALRLACLCGHNTLRAAVAGYDNSHLTEKQLAAMEQLLAAALDAGAKGLSTGLLYVPGKFADRHELVRLLRVVAAHGGVYATHLRSEGNTLLEALAETLECAREAGVAKVQISHFKTAGRANWSKLGSAIRLIEDARRSGVAVTVDRYPYVESMTQLS